MGFASHRKHFRKLLALRSVHYATEIGFQQSWKIDIYIGAPSGFPSTIENVSTRRRFGEADPFMD